MSSSTSPSNFPLSRPFHHQHQQNRNDGNETKEEFKEMENNLLSSGHDPRGGRGGFHFAKYECFSDFLKNPGIDSQLKVTDLSLDSTLLDRPRGVVPVVEGSKVMVGNKAYEKSHIGPNGNIFI